MNQRLKAIEAQEPTYNTGKPCRRGHNSPRYTSNGSCVDCTKLAANSITSIHKIAKARHNLAMAAGLRDYVVKVSGSNRGLIDDICDILQHHNPFAIADIKALVERLHASCPIPNALTRDDLAKFIELDPVTGLIAKHAVEGVPHEYDEEGETYLTHNGYRYLATDVMLVLRRLKLNVPHSGKSRKVT